MLRDDEYISSLEFFITTPAKVIAAVVGRRSRHEESVFTDAPQAALDHSLATLQKILDGADPPTPADRWTSAALLDCLEDSSEFGECDFSIVADSFPDEFCSFVHEGPLQRCLESLGILAAPIFDDELVGLPLLAPFSARTLTIPELEGVDNEPPQDFPGVDDYTAQLYRRWCHETQQALLDARDAINNGEILLLSLRIISDETPEALRSLGDKTTP